MKVDYLIVGQGLAGSLLAWRLLQRGKRILVVDRDEAFTSSKVAAGLVTPLTGSKLKISSAFETRLNDARQCYWDIEDTTNERFFHHLPIAKLFRDEEEAGHWHSRDRSPENPLTRFSAPLDLGQGMVHNEHGGFEMKQGGWLNVPHFLEVIRRHLLERAAYAIGKVDPDELTVSADNVQWHRVTAHTVIFADGWRANTNPYFDWLRMHNALGDILEVKIPDLASLQHIVNRGAWLLPLGGDRFRTGSNYRHRITSTEPDAEGQEEIIGKLKTITPHKFEVIDHQCAVRPIIKRSQIFCGRHPTHHAIAIFNGLGSKGVVNAPWYAERFVDYLENGIPLPNGSDIRDQRV